MSTKYDIIKFMKKFLLLFFSIVAAIYSLFYANLGEFKGNAGALSKIGLEHPILFSLWGGLTCIALFSNVIIGFEKTKYKFHYYLITAAAVGMLLTISFDFDYNDQLNYWLHCIGSMTFSIVMGITVFLLFLLSKNYIFAAASAIILITDLILLIIFKETAIIELFPILSGLIMMVIHNMRKERKAVEIK